MGLVSRSSNRAQFPPGAENWKPYPVDAVLIPDRSSTAAIEPGSSFWRSLGEIFSGGTLGHVLAFTNDAARAIAAAPAKDLVTCFLPARISPRYQDGAVRVVHHLFRH